MNQTYLNHDTYTDIITFDSSTDDFLSGELYISIDRVRENAKQFQGLFRDELHRVMAHGLLHLCGFADKLPQEAKRMRSEEDSALALRKF
jgi:rRNA maturation RNase YbeY